jgi:ribose transport system permease protein
MPVKRIPSPLTKKINERNEVTEKKETAPDSPGGELAATAPRGSGSRLSAGRIAWKYGRDLGIIGAIIVLGVVLTLSSPAFLTIDNISSLLAQNSYIGVMTCAMVIVFIAGGFDLSVGGTFSVAAVVAAKLGVSHPPAEAFAVAVLVGLAIGTANGLIIVLLRVNAFVTTLGTSIILGGLAYVISHSNVILVNSSSFAALGNTKILGLTVPVWIWVLFALLTGALLNWTRFGRHVFAVGDNPESARFTGVRVGAVRAVTFALSGAAAGLGAVIEASQNGAGDPAAGSDNLALAVIAAVVIGGTSLRGGSGAIWRGVAGVLLLGLVTDGLGLLNYSASVQSIVQGSILVIAVALDAWTRRT